MWRIWFYPLLIALAVGVYYGIDYLPQSWREWLKGKKTHVVGLLGIGGPELLQIAMEVQSLGLHESLGPTFALRFSQAVGVLAIVTRLRTNREA